MKRYHRFWVFGVLILLGGCAKKRSSPPPLSPEQELKTFHLSEDFRVELFASEPLVMSPVDMAFDEKGRVYVAEMLDYPEDPPPGKPALSRIVMLEDTDGDGKADKRTVFADHLLEVSGLMPWKGGLVVTCAPDILFLKDTDGDGKADVREVLFTGFPKVNPESRITNPRLNIDNWVYASNHGADGRITSPTHPERPPVLVRGTDFRFRLDRGLAEAASGPAQFGSTFDDWGDRFITENTIHIRHVVIPMQYLVRAPLLEIPAVAQDISDHGRPSARMFPLAAPQEWRIRRTALRQQRYNEQHLHRTEEVAGYFTAASGGTIYNGEVFPEEYRKSVFTGDVSGNLVHRDVLKPDGVNFIASRAKEGVEFLASTDQWFRPCNFANAPDGNLYVMDIYRLFIETPESIPEEIKKGMDFRAGASLGRIWRIVPNHPVKKRDPKPNLSSASTPELVEQLGSANGWHRETAQRLLVERQDRAAVPLLERAAETSAFPQTRLRVLWTLESLSALKPSLVERALQDPDAHIREHALRLSEELAGKSGELADAVFATLQDPEPRVQFQLAFTLGQWKDRRSPAALAEIASRHAPDPWFRTAVLSSVHDSPAPFFRLLLAKGTFAGSEELFSQLATLIGTRHESREIADFLGSLSRLKQPATGLSGLARGLKVATVRGLQVPGAEAALARFLEGPSEQVQDAAWEAAQHFALHALIQKAAARAQSSNLSPERRAVYVRALRGGQYAAVAPVLRQLLQPSQPPQVQIAAADSLAAFPEPSIASELLANWKTYAPATRKKVLDVILNRPDRLPVLVKALEDGQIETGSIDIAARSLLLESPNSDIAQRARRLFVDETSDRAKVVEAYRNVLTMKGDPARGKRVFEEQCGRCHLPHRQGVRVGPDLSGINNKTKEELLTSILNPSYSIEPRFVNYIVTTKDGVIHDGVLAGETPGTITLRNGSDEGDDVILRKNIAAIRASSISLMPTALEKSITKQGLADVITYLRGGL